MFLKEIILDGFKSYPNRTVVEGFDPYFNAITGLNGSGKSNVLDSICFVLGISNLSQVRVSNLQELVYKQGQAGITKASVTLVFDNRDRAQSPVGYEEYNEITITRQIIIGGRNKYMINGVNAQQNRVQNLFHSVQLNVNNPHFLIMQGRITKVMNMKPQETLSMVEEAAGTRMFEMKKISAQKTMEKKDKKVEEINKVLVEEITPTLEKLRSERAQYMKWSSNNTEMERLQRFCVAWDYINSEKAVSKCTEEIKGLHEQQDALKKQVETHSHIAQSYDTQIKDLVDQRAREMDGEFKNLEAKVADVSKELVKHTSTWTNKKETLETEEKQGRDQSTNKAQVESSLESKKLALTSAIQKVDEQDEATKRLQLSVEDLQNKYQAVLAGVQAQGDSDKTLAEELIESKRLLATSQSEMKQLGLQTSHLKESIKDKGSSIKSAEKEARSFLMESEKQSRELENAKAALEGLLYDPSVEKELQKEESIVINDLNRLREKIENLSTQLSGLDFQYSDPVRGFDRSKVKGLVANLIQVKMHEATRALEVVAGGRLYQVVVDSEQTGKLLLQSGNLKKKVTIIPLNKIRSTPISGQSVRRAQEIGGKENVYHALSLVGCDEEIQVALSYVFGGSLVCRDLDTAKTVTFHRDVMARSVTFEGDVFDPAGTLTGGSQPDTRSILATLHEYNDLKAASAEKEADLARIRSKLKEISTLAKQYEQTMKRVELCQHQYNLTQERLKNSSYQQMKDSLEEDQSKLDQCTLQQQKLLEQIGQLNEKCKNLEEAMKNAKKHQENLIKETESRLAAAKKQLASSLKELKARQQKKETLDAEIEMLRKDLDTIVESLVQNESTLVMIRKEVELAASLVAEKKSTYEKLQAELDKIKRDMKQMDQNIGKLHKEKQKSEKLVSEAELELKKMDNKFARIQKDQKEASKLLEHLVKQKSEKLVSEAELELKKMDNKFARIQKDQKEASKLLEHLVKQNPWIPTEKQYFGQSGSDFDFNARNPREAKDRMQELDEEQGLLAKSINKKVMSMFDKAEQDYQDLMSKKKIIETDRLKIEAVIAELEKKKIEALQTTWKKVNRDFASIFSTLLPGTTAKLAPPEGMSPEEGLEVKVAFGEVWKESLSELSGGQRSLLALSLILALLLFKPAPMYILDEVDAALDLSHTQNIGQMLRTHFTHSQFIVVSLKEGMFNNANVLFRTKFIDGVSTITRTVPSLENRAEHPQQGSTLSHKGEQSDRRAKGKRPLQASNS
eukprot:TRINITY_DN13288_c0_g1_i1.p1 TRINITY_DN13288_c0_g1~~TRINITY_DN13288_c0_g1_i1.p1  ORF type:complete len:1250 (+),score=317.58 TRINITY_DN13288_c0_g1_i1:52-3801(+)